MSENLVNSKRIAKNTVLLYFRMFITMVVGLFTSRVILKALGVEDFGIYNLVGGFVAMFAVVRAGLVSATQRFLTFNLGRGDVLGLNRTFSTITLIYLFLCIIVIVIAEIGGIWFLEHKLMIPEERMDAARWVFQLSLLTLILGLLSSSYHSLIIAHERMRAFAYISIYEVLAKLMVAYCLFLTSFDKLIVYAILICIVHVTVPLLYWLYCQRHFREEVKIQWRLEWKKVGEIYSFAGWSMLGGIANIGFTQGLNLVLGMFFTPIVNAARGVAVQVQSMIQQFVINFQMAIDPQIIKSYARGDNDYMLSLISSSSRFSSYLLFIVSLPIMLEAESLLGWWLVEVPANTALFLRLIIVTTFFDAVSNPYGKAIHATGRIRNYQLICSTILIMIVPVAYLILSLGAPAYSVFLVHIVFGFIAMMIRIKIATPLINASFSSAILDNLLPIGTVIVISSLIPVVLHFSLYGSLLRFLVVGFVSALSVLLSVYLLGITSEERSFFLSRIKKLIS